MVALYHPDRIQWARDAENGCSPAVQLYGRSAGAERYLTVKQKKVWLARWWQLGQDLGGRAGTTNLMRFRRRSSQGVTRLQMIAIMGRTSASGAAGPVSPRVDVEVYDGATTTAFDSLYYGLQGTTPTDAPGEWFIAPREIVIAPGTAYECLIKTVNYGRLLGICVRELGENEPTEATEWWNALTASVDMPIYDITRERLLRGLSEMWRYNAGAGIDWARKDGSARTRTSATYANLYDGSTTGTPTAATRGFYLDNTNRRRYSKATVTYELAVYGSIPALGTGTVKLMDTSGNSYGPVSIISATPAWGMAVVELPADARKYDLQYAGDGVNSFSVYAVSLAEYLA